ncbi:relaxase/mobilization nuclease domain-containing protein [Xanthomonas vasicola]|uniref:DNA polymerase n=2 Tax=Xanthomonas vasicola TaxID=56459 RepID=A0A837APS2_XANVA|nr:relaxase/mobilization nuclease domain-containing protein [Xanthomonas vasicola]KFA30056.1 DNA polymerase [Xanthomonas vasicola pv. vasculorum NCPPB 1326]MBV6748219.1 relaxase/mobilization nuclease domain-containing protein [Xanthomonas vasicola pv. vasculorum NCPPB 890]MBV6893878.1 relaxase/mobilization nuclease domain-containing protein [Xanthomonas vasicola pv. vasculorum]MDO6949573.1 relaxase/mobilization nuclease domain-containing protein [Xanthomonas vasicola]MDO6961858.1 relaxase/mobi
MTRQSIELDLSDFADAARITYKKTRKAKRTPRGAKITGPEPPKPNRSGPAIRATIDRIARRVPEVMVKITQGKKNPETGKREVLCKDMRGVRAHMQYISRNGAVELEDENGQRYLGQEDVRDVLRAFARAGTPIPERDGRRREVYSIVLSMPPGTDRDAVKAAARDFAAAEFSGHQYVFAAHDDDAHPHVHLAVKTADARGVRLNPRKPDLQRWRELFAEKLRDHGIEANASDRRLRGIVKKSERQAIRSLNHRGETPRRVAQQEAQAREEAAGRSRHANPAQEKISAGRRRTTAAYGKVARSLATGDAEDRALALRIVELVKAMPPQTTRHEDRVAQLRANAKTAGFDCGADRDAAKDKPEQGRDR